MSMLFLEFIQYCSQILSVHLHHLVKRCIKYGGVKIKNLHALMCTNLE